MNGVGSTLALDSTGSWNGWHMMDETSARFARQTVVVPSLRVL